MGMSGALTSAELAALIVDALIDAKLVSRSAASEAITVVAQEIDVRKAMGDYSSRSVNSRRGDNPS
jgi:hypothetical protein